MKVLSKNLLKRSGQAGDNARGWLDLDHDAAHSRIGGPLHLNRFLLLKK